MDISTFTKYALVAFSLVVLLTMLGLYVYSALSGHPVPDFVTSVLYAGVGASLNAIGVQHGANVSSSTSTAQAPNKSDTSTAQGGNA